jgi:protein-tyrosine phosphatase
MKTKNLQNVLEIIATDSNKSVLINCKLGYGKV